MLLPFVGQLGPVYDHVVRFHLAAARTTRDNLRLIDEMLYQVAMIVTDEAQSRMPIDMIARADRRACSKPHSSGRRCGHRM